MRRDTRILRRKAITSLRRATGAFNAIEDEGRHTTVLLHLQHAFEMLLKASLHQRRVPVEDSRTGQSIGFKKCLNLAPMHLGMRAEDVGALRAIDRLRDDEYHYLGLVSEGILYVHLRAGVSIFDRVLREVFGETLSDQLPARVLPISTEAPRDLDVLIDDEFSQVRDLLRPGRRRRGEARARIRTLLALEGHVVEGVEVSETDVDRVERAIRDGNDRGAVFPRLTGLSSRSSGVNVTIKVQTSRREGMPVQLIDADDPRDAAAVREVDLQRRFCFSRTDLARHVDLTPPRCAALRAELEIDGDSECHHQFRFGQSVHDAYSGLALQRMRDALATGLDMDEVWARHKERRRAPASG
jgi:hypothetical protein